MLRTVRDGTINTVFADPPFNLGKNYRGNTNDNREEQEYLNWCRHWLGECYRVLKPGGALFLYHLPKWNIILANHLSEIGMLFRHWIAIELTAGFPIAGKLYPAHYSLLYFTKGSPRRFRKIRTPVPTCRHCGDVIKIYGGKEKYVLSNGINLKDIWTDVRTVRSGKYKSGFRKANALSTVITDRIVDLTTDPGDIVLDPFGGSGTTFVSCEGKERNWIGMEIDYVDDIIYRLTSGEVLPHQNHDIVSG